MVGYVGIYSTFHTGLYTKKAYDLICKLLDRLSHRRGVEWEYYNEEASEYFNDKMSVSTLFYKEDRLQNADFLYLTVRVGRVSRELSNISEGYTYDYLFKNLLAGVSDENGEVLVPFVKHDPDYLKYDAKTAPHFKHQYITNEDFAYLCEKLLDDEPIVDELIKYYLKGEVDVNGTFFKEYIGTPVDPFTATRFKDEFKKCHDVIQPLSYYYNKQYRFKSSITLPKPFIEKWLSEHPEYPDETYKNKAEGINVANMILKDWVVSLLHEATEGIFKMIA